MAISFVKAATQAQTSSGTSQNCSFGSAPGATGNSVVVAVCDWHASGVTVSSVTDNLSNPYILVTDGTHSARSQITADGVGVELWWCRNLTSVGSALTLTITMAKTACDIIVNAIEVSGLDTSSANCDSVAASSSTSSVSSYTQTNSAANSTANSLEVAIVSPDTGNSSTSITNPPSGWNSMLFQGNGNTFIACEAAYRIATSTETASANWATISPSSTATVATIASFKVTGAGGDTLMAQICM